MSAAASPLGVPAQSSQSSPLLSAATQPQSLSHESPFGTPAQSAHEELSPPHTPHSSFSRVEPHVLSQPEGAGSSQPHPKSVQPSSVVYVPSSEPKEDPPGPDVKRPDISPSPQVVPVTKVPSPAGIDAPEKEKAITVELLADKLNPAPDASSAPAAQPL